MEDANVRNMISGKPYRLTALEYHRRGWFPFPLPPRQKNPPPSGTTGRKNKMPEDRLEAVTEFLAEYPPDSNIGLWMDHTVIGIDVDHYEAKKGGDQLEDLEQRLGKLPQTWVSSARTDGKSGIRFFRIPARYWPGTKLGGAHGLSFSGKAAAAIDVVQACHRFACVGPSWHPDLHTEYRWFAPGEPLDEVPSAYRTELTWRNKKTPGGSLVSFRKKETAIKIPRVDELPELPKAWVEFLSRGYIKDDLKPRDIESSERTLLAWAAKHFPGGKTGKPCKTVRKAMATHKRRIKESESSHDVIVDIHWNILKYGLEGHRGALKAAQTLETLWTKAQLKGNEIHGQKRGMNEAGGEIFRSRVEALRKIKGEADGMFEMGADPFKTGCTCFDEEQAEPMDPTTGPVPTGKAKDPGEYDKNDDDNGEHLIDLYGDDLKYVEGLDKWIYWDGSKWIRDNSGSLVRRCYRRVKERQQAYAMHLLNQASKNKQEASEEKEVKEASALMKKAIEWKQWADRSGNNSQARAAIEAARANLGVEIEEGRLDNEIDKLGVENGLLILGKDGVKFTKPKREDYVTLNTGIPYIPLREQFHMGGDARTGLEMWQGYLDLFIPDPELRAFTQKAMGYCLFGRNPEKLAFFLKGESNTGKSTLLSCILAAIGEYGSTVSLNIFQDRASGLNPALAEALPKRIITASEASSNKNLHDDVFKRITGGDMLAAELKGVNVIIKRVPNFTPVVATNVVPMIDQAGEATLKRLAVIPFLHQHTGAQKEQAALEMAAPMAVLAWLVEGYALYAREGLSRDKWPASVLAETGSFGRDLNELMDWMDDHVERVEVPPQSRKVPVDEKGSFTVPASRMYEAYVQWADSQGARERDIMTLNMFGRKMTGMGILRSNVMHKGSNIRCYIGVSLKEPKLKFGVTSARKV